MVVVVVVVVLLPVLPLVARVVVVVVVVVVIVVVVVVVVAMVVGTARHIVYGRKQKRIVYGITHAANLIMNIPWGIPLFGQRISHMAHRMPHTEYRKVLAVKQNKYSHFSYW